MNVSIDQAGHHRPPQTINYLAVLGKAARRYANLANVISLDEYICIGEIATHSI